MLKIPFNDGWAYRKTTEEKFLPVTLPHDAQISEKRSANADGGTNTGWFLSYDYEYEKHFFAPCEYKDKNVFLEFEGVYRNAEVYLNGEKICFRAYGYTNFYVDLTEKIKTGEDNVISVIAENSDQPNSRWYSGAGIYRPVYLYVADKKHILLNGVKVKTLSINPAKILISVALSEAGEFDYEIKKGESPIKSGREITNANGFSEFEVVLNDAELWSEETPRLYELSVKFCDDVFKTNFGVRKLYLSAKRGFEINGKRVILRGACIHHDNGILGARGIKEAEERKIDLLKKCGYNAIRSAHNPCSKFILDYCDKVGMLVLDEYSDMWYIHKTRFDYASELEKEYPADIRDMVEKDYNHPCVIGYSLGNEVAETSEKKGVEFFAKMRDEVKKYDDTRFVTAGVNIFFNFLYKHGFGVYSDKKAQLNPEKKVGSEFFNNLAGILGAKFMKNMAKLGGCDRATREPFARMDVAGYNYGILRYKKDVKKYPERIILGTETFCADAYEFMKIAEKNPAVIGDFVWAGMDYLGEVGVGAWEYPDYAPSFLHGVGWITAGSGRVDLVGTMEGEAAYTRVAFGIDNGPIIAVKPLSGAGKKHSPSAWKFTNAIKSWSWDGYEGKKAEVEVYTRSEKVELYLNGKLKAAKKRGKDCRVIFKIKYEPGELTAVSYDKGAETARYSLKTAEKQTVLSLSAEKPVKRGEVAFVNIDFTDENGTVKQLERGIVKLEVKGGELLGLGNACSYNEIGYCENYTDTYYGRALAVIKKTGDECVVSASCNEKSGKISL